MWFFKVYAHDCGFFFNREKPYFEGLGDPQKIKHLFQGLCRLSKFLFQGSYRPPKFLF